MKGQILFLFCFCMSVVAVYSQTDQANLWNSVLKQEDNRDIITMPDGWRKVDIANTSGLDYKFDFSGTGVPATVGGAPLYANFTITRMSGNKHGQAMDQVINDFAVFYDRVTEPGYNYDTTMVTIKSGQA